MPSPLFDPGYPHHGSFNAPNGVNYKFAGGGGGGGAGGGGGGHICQQTDNPAYSGGWWKKVACITTDTDQTCYVRLIGPLY